MFFSNIHMFIEELTHKNSKGIYIPFHSQIPQSLFTTMNWADLFIRATTTIINFFWPVLYRQYPYTEKQMYYGLGVKPNFIPFWTMNSLAASYSLGISPSRMASLMAAFIIPISLEGLRSKKFMISSPEMGG